MENTYTKALMVDANYLCHTVYHTMPALSFDTKPTQIVYGFIKRVISLAVKFPSDNIVFTWDSKSSIRKEVYPKYKEARRKAAGESSDEEKAKKRMAYLQFDDIRDVILPELGFANVYMAEGFEADDIMAAIVNSNTGYEFIVATTDKDMYQIVNDRCSLYNPATKLLTTVSSFEKEFGCHPSLWGEARSISGCSTDNVIGVKGVGEKTAIKYLYGELKPTSEKYKDIEQSKSIIDDNRELIVLPLYGTPDIEINRNNNLSRHKFVKFCEKYGFKSLLSSSILNKWDSIIRFSGPF